MKRIILAMAMAAFCMSMNARAETKFVSGPTQTALVELYTSEGCSSCPPAEAWMSRLQGYPGLWKQFVPLAFHVDYWNYLGWRDRFSSPQWTTRQRHYGALWRSGSVYTPAVAVNGREMRNWSGLNPARPNEQKTGLLSARSSDGKTFVINFQPAPAAGRGSWQAHVALLACDIQSSIGGGENSGRKLKHDFVVLELRDGPMKAEGGSAQASLTMGGASEAGARKAVAVWVTAGDELTPVQATGGWLP